MPTPTEEKNAKLATTAAPAPAQEQVPELEGLEAVQSLIGDSDTGKSAEAIAVAVNGGQTSKVAIEEIGRMDLATVKKLVADAVTARIVDPTIAAKWLHRKYPESRRRADYES